jgi:hypothetical protein
MVTPLDQFLYGMSGPPRLPTNPADLPEFQARIAEAARVLPPVSALDPGRLSVAGGSPPLEAIPPIHRFPSVPPHLPQSRVASEIIPVGQPGGGLTPHLGTGITVDPNLVPTRTQPLGAIIPGEIGAIPTGVNPNLYLRTRKSERFPDGGYILKTDLNRLTNQNEVVASTTPDLPVDPPGGSAEDIITQFLQMLTGGEVGTTVTPNSTTFFLGSDGLKILSPDLDINIPLQPSGRYRTAIETALRSAGVAESSITMLLGEYDATEQGAGELPASPASSDLSIALGNLISLFTQPPPDVAGRPITQTLNQQFANLFNPPTSSMANLYGSAFGVSPQVSPTDALDPATIASMFTPTTDGGAQPATGFDQALTNFDSFLQSVGLSGLTDSGTMFNYPGTDTTGPFGGPASYGNVSDLQNFIEGFYPGTDASGPFGGPSAFGSPRQTPETSAANLVNSLFSNQAGSTDILTNARVNLFGESGEGELLSQLFGTDLTFKNIADIFEKEPQTALIMAQGLGQQNVGLLQTLLTTATNEQQFTEAVRQFEEGLKFDKQDQQIGILNSMMEMTLSQMGLDLTAQNNLMNAQISAMNTALKSKELSQSEQANIRSNMLAVVDLELQEQRINNDQANFLTNTLLATHELALRVRELDQRGEIATADRELEREGMALTERMGLTEITANMLTGAAERELGREGLGLERELGFANIGQREREAGLSAQVALLNAAMANPYSFAALRSLGGIGGIPGMQGGAATTTEAMPAGTTPAGVPPQLFPGLADIGFQIPQAAQAGAITPAPQFFTGGMPTVGALSNIDPASLQFLQNVLGFSGTSPEGFGRQAGAVTPAPGGFQGVGRTLYG